MFFGMLREGPKMSCFMKIAEKRRFEGVLGRKMAFLGREWL
jgi:hypothetical protein